MLTALISIFGMLIYLFQVIVIFMMILSLLIAFNVVNLSNQFVAALWQAANAIVEPFLRPIRRIMPDTGVLDFSPMVLIFGLYIVQELLKGAQQSLMYGTL